MPIFLRILAIIFILYGLVQFTTGLRGIWLTLQYLLYSSHLSIISVIYVVPPILIFSVLIPLCSIIAGIGILKVRTWGWYLAIAVSGIVCAFDAYSVFIHITAILGQKEHIYTMVDIQDSSISYVSMDPTYISLMVSLFILIALFNRRVKDQIKNNT